MIILGIDPGSRKVGFGIIESQGRNIKHLASGCIKLDPKQDYLQRLKILFTKVTELTQKYSIDEISLESLIYVKSPTALIKLAQARGAILTALLQTHEGKIFEYSPNLIKSVAVGDGHADKKSVQKVLSYSIGIDEFESDDESDALAAAICHSVYRGREALMGRPTKKRKNASLKNSLKHKMMDV
ncbi:MAG: crossover junction endodeoxyribonuclease RuvC [Bacteriovoracaceae bacterium]|nr:crossover junction endodeoxyribonuclease RuvC [Bacteriovoracaceae bacterium]